MIFTVKCNLFKAKIENILEMFAILGLTRDKEKTYRY